MRKGQTYITNTPEATAVIAGQRRQANKHIWHKQCGEVIYNSISAHPHNPCHPRSNQNAEPQIPSIKSQVSPLGASLFDLCLSQ
jgi:hypothetical protein